MEAIRKVVNSYRGLFSFGLVLFFLLSFTAKNFIYSLPSHHKTEAAHHPVSGKQIVSASLGNGSSQSLLDQLQDSDSDDIEIVFYSNSVSKIAIPPAAKHEFSEFAPYHSIYKVPLYDLYCNWKFHLS